MKRRNYPELVVKQALAAAEPDSALRIRKWTGDRSTNPRRPLEEQHPPAGVPQEPGDLVPDSGGLAPERVGHEHEVMGGKRRVVDAAVHDTPPS